MFMVFNPKTEPTVLSIVHVLRVEVPMDLVIYCSVVDLTLPLKEVDTTVLLVGSVMLVQNS